MAESSSIIVCKQRFDVGRRVINFEDDPSISAYTPRCYSRPDIFPYAPAKGLGQMAQRYRPRRLIGADASLPRLQQVIKQFVVHHDGMGSSRDCFRVLHDERGLSVHFLIDNNGDIYQTLDLVDCGFQAAGVNEISVGVELCNRGDALTYPEFYKGPNKIPRDKVTCSINGHQWLAFDYTKEQYDAMIDLGRALGRILPGIKQDFPEDGAREPLWTTMDTDPRNYSGYLGHFHVTNQKWDPGPWDFKRFVQKIRGRTFYPAIPSSDKAELPDDLGKVAEIEAALYDNNEKDGEGGYFPVGPMGVSRLWHGGLHLRADEPGGPVVAPFGGQLIAARHKPEDDWSPVGSPNFVLLRHEMAVGGALLKFFTLLMHLGEEKDEAQKPPWMKHARDRKWSADLSAGDVAIIDEPVGAGDVVGHFGQAGPRTNWKAQIHFEIFSEEELGEKVEAGFWKTIDGSKMGRFCSAPEIVAPIDADRNGTLSPREFVNFFQNNPAREQFHKMAVRHLSEWGDNNDFEVALNKARDFGRLPKAEKHRLFEEQIASMMWWTEKLDGMGLPDDKLVWSYHPITFVAWVNEKLKGQPQRGTGVSNEASFRGKKPPAHIKDDREATDGFMDDEDALFGEAAKSLDLEKLSAGYPD